MDIFSVHVYEQTVGAFEGAVSDLADVLAVGDELWVTEAAAATENNAVGEDAQRTHIDVVFNQFENTTVSKWKKLAGYYHWYEPPEVAIRNRKAEDTITEYMGASAPTAPFNLAGQRSGSWVSLTWDQESGEDEFEIHRDSGSGYSQIDTVGRNHIAYIDKNAPSGECWYKVRASNSAGNSAFTTAVFIDEL